MSTSLLHVGLGPLGVRIERDLVARGAARVTAAVDSAPELAGRPLAELVPGSAPGVRVSRSLEDVHDFEEFDAALVTTSSDLRACADTLRVLLDHGLPVVSTCEELVYPWLRHRELADELDRLARSRGAQLLGTGVNPGFVMDALPLFASAVCNRVRSVRIERVQDASSRRIPFQRKIGAGLTTAEFEQRVADGSLRHVGLGESLHLVAGTLGFAIERWNETIEPVIAVRALDCALGPIAPGQCAGVRQVARGWSNGEVAFELEFQAAIGQADPRDRVVLDADPPIDLVIRGGVHGDTATSAIVINAIPSLLGASPGLHTMATLPLVACRNPSASRAASAKA